MSSDFDNNYHKQQCEELRQIRVKMADTLGVPYVVRKEPCNFKGECSGTCPACYMEEKALMERIYELAIDGRLNMFFGEDIEKLKEKTSFEEVSFGQIIEGDVIEDNGTFPNEFEDCGFTPNKPIYEGDKPFYGGYKPTHEIPVPPSIPLPGMIVAPRFNEEGKPELPKSPVTKIDTTNYKKGLFGRKKK